MRTHTTVYRIAGAATVLACLGACSPASLVDVDPASTLVDPSVVKTPAGAEQLYNYALNTFVAKVGGNNSRVPGADQVVLSTALFTDELMTAQTQFNNFRVGVDERTDGTFPIYGWLYQHLHQARVHASQAREALTRYAPGTMARQGHMYALEAFTIVYFAEIFCSGIPLTTVPLEGSAVLGAGLTTEELLERAIMMFDSAITLASDSLPIVNLSKIGKARSLLFLGRFSEAAGAVSDIPTDFIYWAEFDPTAVGSPFVPAANALGMLIGPGVGALRAQVVDNEGGTGLDWSNDPRTGVMTDPSQFGAMLLPAKYSRSSAGALQTATTLYDNPIRVADGLEARLIEAEAGLDAGNPSWLTILNDLRATCVGNAACAPVPGISSADLPPLSDPGTDAARLDLLMRERAMWLYLTGHRQGDLRRMARLYGHARETLWPTGTYSNPGFPPFTLQAPTHGSTYGSDVVYTPQPNEQQGNPLYNGCFNLDP